MDPVILIVLLLLCCCSISILGGGAFFLTRPQEGDTCKGSSVGGNYVIDEDGKCVLDSCDAEYTRSGDSCLAQGRSEEISAPSPAQREEATPVQREEATPADEYANGSMIHLDRHNVDCGTGGLTGFSLDMQDTDKMMYNYKCRDDIGETLSAEKNSGANDWGDNNVIFLDRHTLDCGKKPIAQFKLYRPQLDQIAYSYKCNETEAKGECRELDIVSSITGEQNKTDTLMDADPQCESDEVLTKFRHYRANPNTPNESAAYKYTCCKL